MQAPAENRDAAARKPPVGLELGLAGASRSHSAVHTAGPQTLEVLPHSPHARQVVLELGQLDLELALRAVRMLGEDVEDQLGPVDDPRLELVFQSALLRRRELVVDEERFRAGGGIRVLELRQLSFADEGAGIRPLPMLDERADGVDAGSASQLGELVELALLVDTGRDHGHDESPLRLHARSGFWPASGHARIMTFCSELSIRRTASSS